MNRNYFYNLLLSVVNILFPIITFPYASHIIGPDGIGKVQHAIFFAESFALIAALGIPLYGISAIAKSNSDAKRSKTFSELILIHGITGLIFSVVYFLIITTVPFFKPHLPLYTTAGLIVLLGFTSVDWFYSGLAKFKLIALRSVFIKLISVVLLFVFVKSSLDFLNYLCILIFSLVGNNIISLILIRKHTRLRLKGIKIKKHLRPVLFVLGSNIAINMYAIWDTLLLGFLTNDKTVGLYFAAVKLVKFSIPFIISLGVSIIPSLTLNMHNKNKAEVDRLLAESFQFIIFLAIPIAIGTFSLAREFILVLSGNEFLAAIPTMQVVAILPLFIGLGHFFSLQILVPSGLNKQMFYATFAGVVSSLILNFSLIPFFGSVGSATANIVSEFVVTGLFYYYVNKHFEIHIDWYLLLKAAISCILFIPIVYLTRYYFQSPVLVLFLSGISCALIYLLFQRLFFKNQFLIKISDQLFLKFQNFAAK